MLWMYPMYVTSFVAIGQ